MPATTHTTTGGRRTTAVDFPSTTQGNYLEAEHLFQGAITIKEQTLGANHWDVASSLRGLAALYRQQGRYEQAEHLQRALSIREQCLGSEHPDVAEILKELALLYLAQGRYTEAEVLLQRALTLVEQGLGREHPDLVIILNSYTALLGKTDRDREAGTVQARAQAIQAKQEKGKETLSIVCPDYSGP
jgi:tetratricopeptide (TPR) repeat protein